MPVPKSNKRIIKSIDLFFIYFAVLIIIILSIVNINTYLTPRKIKVLGASTENNDITFWQEFLTKNPSYIPGWIETGRTDKASEIDPNYLYE